MKKAGMMPIGSKVRVKRACPGGRWAAGEVGTLEKNDFDKYDYRVFFGVEPMDFNGEMIQYYKVFYFFADEVEPV